MQANKNRKKQTFSSAQSLDDDEGNDEIQFKSSKSKTSKTSKTTADIYCKCHTRQLTMD